MSNDLDRDRFDRSVRDANYAARRTTPSVLVWIGVIVAVVAVIGGIVYGIRVAFAPAKGAGDTVIKDQDANNRIAQQRAFVNMYEGVKASDRKLKVLADAAARNPADPKAQADFAGTQLVCLDQVADYNAKVQETLAANWLPAELPTVLGGAPDSDCAPDSPLAPAPLN